MKCDDGDKEMTRSLNAKCEARMRSAKPGCEVRSQDAKCEARMRG